MSENSTQENNIPKNSTTTKPKKKRDYKREYALRKAKGGQRKDEARLTVCLSVEQNAAFEEKIAAEPPDENGNKVTKRAIFARLVDAYLAGKI